MTRSTLGKDVALTHDLGLNNDKIFTHVLDATNRTCDGTFKTTDHRWPSTSPG